MGTLWHDCRKCGHSHLVCYDNDYIGENRRAVDRCTLCPDDEDD